MNSAILHRELRSGLPTVTGGSGAWLIDAEGRRYLDASGGAAVSCLGHNHPAIMAAISDQLDRIEFAHTSFFTSEPAEVLAARLTAAAPTGFVDGRVLFIGGGSEAVESALKLARQYHVERGEGDRSVFISRNMSYHGNSIGALAAGGHAGRRALYQPMLMDVTFVSPCFAYRFQAEGESDAAYVARLERELVETIERTGAHRIAAFLAEPMVGATIGAVPPVPGYFAAVRRVCDHYGILLIADEVMCGMGRTGTLFAMEQEGVSPDLITIAKGLGAGYQPIGGLLANGRVVNALIAGSGRLAHGHTYMAHPIACAAALAVLDTIERDDLLTAVEARGAQLMQGLRVRFGDHPNVGDIRGRGLLLALELVQDRATKAPFAPSTGLAARIKQTALANGLICYPSSGTADGTAGDHVLLAPPFTVSEGEVDEIVERLAGVFESALDQQLVAA